MSTEAVKTWAARPWARQLANLQTRAIKRGLREQPSPLAEITEDALAVGSAMLQELAQQHVECAQLRSELNGQVAAWDHLFDVMPIACVLTDKAGVVVGANRASGLLLNVSAKRLLGRPLIVFFEDRGAFDRISQDVRSQGATVPTQLVVRPRERRPSMVTTVAAPAMTPGGEWTLWFLGRPGESATTVSEMPEPTVARSTGRGEWVADGDSAT